MSYTRYFSPAQVESDQKDLIISQLKADIFELKKTEEEMYNLSQELKSLENRYQQTMSEKDQNEDDFMRENEMQSRQISDLRNEIENLRKIIKEKTREFEELKIESQSLNDLNEQRSFQINKMKKDLSDGIDQHKRLYEDKNRNEEKVSSLRLDNDRLESEKENALKEIEGFMNKSKDLENLIKEEKMEKARREKDIQNTKYDNEKINNENRELADQLNYLIDKIASTQREIMNKKNDLEELEGMNEKVKGDIYELQKNIEAEQGANRELLDKKRDLEGLLQKRESQIARLKDDSNSYKMDNARISEGNSQLNVDIESLKQTIIQLEQLNSELVAELERYCEEDETARAILNRRPRVFEVKSKTENISKKTSTVVGYQSKVTAYSGYSPSKLPKKSPAKY